MHNEQKTTNFLYLLRSCHRVPLFHLSMFPPAEKISMLGTRPKGHYDKQHPFFGGGDIG